jgi:hypothetical protein
MNFHRILLAGLLWLTLASCAPLQASRPSSPLPTASIPTRQRPAQIPPMSTPSLAKTPAVSPPVEKFVARAKQDLASQLTVTVDQIILVEAMPITWPDAALGCPDPGKVYAQGTVPGYRITLEANGVNYIYHTDQTGKMVLCPEVNLDEVNPTAPAKPIPTPTYHIGVPIK